MSDIRFNRWLHQSGTGGVYQDSSGNVGVGTSVPRASIDIAVGSASSIRIGTAITISHSNGIQIGSSSLHSTGLDVQSINAERVLVTSTGSVGIGTTIPLGTLQVGAGTSTFIVTGIGSVGIGTTIPRAPLHVVGSGTTALLVSGNARITGILTVGTSSLTFDGNANTITGLSTITGSSNFSKPNLSGISSTTADTAVDVFVYDTRKDSDGGAWRKRTQHTSWYNETLNTATRGSRRDFPSVAVIVSTLTKVTIYDGDDPDLPMWMVFDSDSGGMSGTKMVQYANQNGYFIHALNGILVIGQKSNADNYGSPIIRFISEYVNRMDPQTGSEGGVWNGSIADRNTTAGYRVSSTETYGIVNSIINDVAMTVLPNAPIDPSTGLPVPTIAVATQGGISILTDSGTVYNLTPESEPAYASIKNFFSVGFDSNQKPFFTDTQTGSGYSQFIYLPNYNYNQSLSDTYSYLSGSYSYAWDSYTRATTSQVGYWAPSNTVRLIKLSVATKDSIAIGYTGSGLGGNGLSLIGQQDNYLMNCGITTTFNTGWLFGNTQGAFLSDTNATNVTGTQLVTNGDFASGTTGWTAGTGATLSVTSGVLRVTNTGTNGRAISNTFSTVIGKKYVLTADGISKTTSNYYMEVRGPEVTTTWASGTGSLYFTAVGTTTYVELYALGSGSTYSEYDNVSVRIVEDDRSVNNKGLAVYGTIAKTAVATGADLVAYTNSSNNSNYLSLPLSSSTINLTANFSVCYWFKSDGTEYNGWSIVENDISSQSGYNKTVLNWYTQSGPTMGYRGASITGSADITYSTNVWNFIAITKTSAGIVMYLNGIVVSSTGGSCANPSVPYSLRLFQWTYNANFYGTGQLNMSLFRLSQSVPSPDQILKIYNDEKMLFQENSKAVLYGTSSAVTALAYDDTTRLLSVGTSSGRSDFQGLERINNTTTAVTTAISASNGLIVEQ